MSDVLPRLTTALESRYRVAREVGVGGMATVYLAHDLRHERDVAIKVLHPDLAAALGADRFLAEIKTTAKLQHPHILALLDSGEAGGLLYYVMPYVAGESLRARLDRETQLAVDDAVRIAREVASALDYAHRNGVVHRDIKPENILLHEDQALVADFGIALAVSAAGGPRMTQTGLSLGTPAYMAPEQAMGERAIDGRADIYALGAVLYEMLVGEAPFTGPTVQAIVARVMTENPRPVTGQRKSVPANVNAAVLRALEKLPADRFHSPAEFSAALVTSSFSSQASATSESLSISRARIPRATIPWAVAAIAIAAAVVFAVSGKSDSNNEAPIHLSVDLPSEMDLPPGSAEVLGISDDGQILAFGGQVGGTSQLVLRRLGSDSFTSVPGASDLNGSAVFSADGKWIAFNAGGKVLKAPVSGGPPSEIGQSRWAHMSWIGSEGIVFTRNYDTGLSRVSSEGRDTITLTKPDRPKGELGHWWPQLLPDGDHVLFTNYTTPADKSKIEVLSLKSGKRQLVLDGGYFGRYIGSHLVFVKSNALMSVSFDPSSFRVKGNPVPLPLDVEINPPNGWAGFAVSKNGTLVYRTDVAKHVELVWVDDAGNEESAVDSAGRYMDAVVSPDGRRIGMVRDGDVWVYDRERGISTRLTNTEQRETNLHWTPDGRQVVYSRDVPQYDIFRRFADASSPEELVMTSPNDKTPTSVSPDGKLVLYNESAGDGEDIFAVPLEGAGPKTRQSVIALPLQQEAGAFSPDGKWIVYTSSEQGRPEVYLTPYPARAGAGRQQVSTAGGDEAEWSPDGHAIFYSWFGKLYRANVNPATGDVGKPELLRRVQVPLGWTVARDGRFLVGRLQKGHDRRSIKVILNWASTLDAKN
jgi:serine/threonine-protein kinase